AQSNTQLKGEAFEDITLPTADLFPTVNNYAVSTTDYSQLSPPAIPNEPLSNCRIVALDQAWKPIAKDVDVPPASGMNIGAKSYFYQANADVTLRNIAGKPVRANVRRIFEKEIGSPWMYAIFYTDRLEIHPGPEFHVTGWVHTNENLYNAHESLWMESKVTYAGQWINDFAPGDSRLGKEKPTNPHTNPDMPPRKEEVKAPMGMKPLAFDTTDGNNNNDGFRELIERPDTS